MTQWERDLKRGKAGEKRACEILNNCGWTIEDKTADYGYRILDIDLVVSKGEEKRTIEIKTDYRAADTGNLYIEYYNYNNKKRNYKGWYEYCAADYLGFVVSGQLLIISNAELHEYIRKHRIKTAWSRQGDTAGYIVPLRNIVWLDSYYELGEKEEWTNDYIA